MKKLILFKAIAVLGITNINAQTWPAAHNLASSNYTFNTWASASTANTFPASMKFYFLGNIDDPTSTDTIAEDYVSTYSLSSGTRINGLGTDGFSFINTGSSALSANGYKLGAAVVALNTTDRAGVQVSWTGKTITPNNRTTVVRLFYRVGDSGAWSAVMDGTNYVEYFRNATANHSENLPAVTLPSAVNDQPLVQLQWKYFLADTNTASGARAQLAVTNIKVTSIALSAVSRIHTDVSELNFHARVGNISIVDSIEVSGGNISGAIDLLTAAPFEISETISGTYGTTLSLPANVDTVEPTYIYVRYSPTVALNEVGTINLSSGFATEIITLNGTAYVSTDPTPVALSTSDYSFTEWDMTTTAGTFPDHTAFHYTVEASPKPTAYPLNGDWHCGYDLSSRPRFNGLDDAGVSFINTGSAQYDDCASGSNNMSVFVGGIVVGLNTLDIDSAVVVDYTLQLLTRGAGATAREYAVRLQYREGTDADFKDFSTPVVFSSEGNTELDSVNVSLSLDASLFNLPNVQLRWLYCDLDIAGAEGSRPSFRLDEVSIKGYKKTNSVIKIDNNNSVVIFPNPVKRGNEIHFSAKITASVLDVTGREMLSVENATTLNTSVLSSGIYIIKTIDGGVAKFIVE